MYETDLKDYNMDKITPRNEPETNAPGLTLFHSEAVTAFPDNFWERVSCQPLATAIVKICCKTRPGTGHKIA